MLRNLLFNSDERRDATIAAGCLSPLVSLLSHASSAVVKTVAAAIWSLVSGNDAHRDAAIAAGCLVPLVALLSHAPADAVTSAA